jgi:cyclic pyranopterin phosphate synthase
MSRVYDTLYLLVGLIRLPSCWSRRLKAISVPVLLEEIEAQTDSSPAMSISPALIFFMVKLRVKMTFLWRRKRCLLASMLIYYFLPRTDVLITTQCNRSCSYCFAKFDIKQANGTGGGESKNMSLENYDEVIKFFLRSELKCIGILGGEPTIHPHFKEIMDRTLDAGLDIKLFSGGLISKSTMEYLGTLDPERIHLILNINSEDDCTVPGEYERTIRPMYKLPQIASLGYNIHKPDFDASFIVDLIVDSGCRKNIRLGMGLPQIGDSEVLLPPDKYKEVAKRVVELARLCDEHDISMGLDCGFALCMFTPEELGYLRVWNCRAEFICNPIIDIGPDLDVWTCFPLAEINRIRFEDFSTRQEMASHFEDQQSAYRTFGIYEECHTCKSKIRSQCAGGCMSHTIRSFQ